MGTSLTGFFSCRVVICLCVSVYCWCEPLNMYENHDVKKKIENVFNDGGAECVLLGSRKKTF